MRPTRRHVKRSIRQQKFLLCVCLLLLMAAIPAAAQAERRCQAPPGRSGIDQYCETVPGAGGDEGSGRHTGAGRNPGSGSTLSRGTRSQLRSAGEAGAGVLNLVDGDNSTKQKKKSPASSSKGGGDRSSSNSVSSNPLSAVRSGVESGSSAGPVFLWALLAVAAVFLALGWLRYRRRAG
jgi:hypothetical protein